MKNFLMILMVLFFSTALFSSCKKHYKCSCQDGMVENPYLHKLSKSEANNEKTKCEANVGCVFKKDK